ncbi:uncharacterized protein LOC127873623 isoform X3 [Dreissena polymorpha]|uniref:uncharacterized protein LOC127873623 isoform X3 n=1 Tax=Dreissena polymorpha TaxID=45954 RepID=UPI002264B24C|nr:uncharacterized protein LOC127873623 isoform X3 [Dreissena polymorpha]
MALSKVRSKLRKFLSDVNLDPDIQRALNQMVSKGMACCRKFKDTMAEEGAVILFQKELLISAVGPSDVNVRDMQTAFDEICRKLIDVRDDGLAWQTDVHGLIELCRGRIKQDGESLVCGQLSEENILTEIEGIDLETATNYSEVETMNQDATRLDQGARELERQSVKKKDTGIGGIVMSVVGAVLAPITGGLSLALTAGGGVLAAGDLKDEAGCRSQAEQMRSQAQDKRKNARELEKKAKSPIFMKNILAEQIGFLRSKKDQFEQSIASLQSITTSLNEFILEIDHALNVFQVLDTVFKDVCLKSESFEIMQNALKRNPARVAERAQGQLRDLQDKWLAMETMLSMNGVVTSWEPLTCD